METRFKKVYIEILNYCNLNCPFCDKTIRELRALTKEEFNHIISQVKDYTDYVYLHVQGEPFIHKDIFDFIKLCNDNKLFVNITTNGTLIKDNIDNIINSNIRQLNISLQALDYLDNRDNYLKSIIELIKKNKNTYISLRLWGNGSYKYYVDYFMKELNSNSDLTKTNRIIDNVFFSFDEEFEWPSIDNSYCTDKIMCNAIDQLAILSDGSVTTCCLDRNGENSFGNIFNDSLCNILNSSKYKMYIDYYKKQKPCFELCKHCSFKRGGKYGNYN